MFNVQRNGNHDNHVLDCLTCCNVGGEFNVNLQCTAVCVCRGTAIVRQAGRDSEDKEAREKGGSISFPF